MIEKDKFEPLFIQNLSPDTSYLSMFVKVSHQLWNKYSISPAQVE